MILLKGRTSPTGPTVEEEQKEKAAEDKCKLEIGGDLW